jgi:hypothetical protein
MNYQKEELESKNLEHLGIIPGIIDEIEIVKKINEIFLIDSREKVNTGEIIKAINYSKWTRFCMKTITFISLSF